MPDITRREAWYGAAPIDLDVLAGLKVPKVVVMGARRPPSGPNTQARRERVSKAMAQRLGARLVVLTESTHFPPHEEPAAFNHLLKETWR